MLIQADGAEKHEYGKNPTHWDHPVGQISVFWHLHGSQHRQVDVAPK